MGDRRAGPFGEAGSKGLALFNVAKNEVVFSLEKGFVQEDVLVQKFIFLGRGVLLGRVRW